MAAVHYSTRDSIEELGRLASKLDTRSIKSEADCHVYKKRWLMLTIYMLCAVAVNMHWLHYTITAHTVIEYYGVSDYIIDLTSVIFGITFIAFVFPAIWLIEKYGLKNMLVCGDGLILAASGLKLGSLEPENFFVGFIGQVLAGIAQVFILNVPSYLAGLWFPRDEISTACALGVMGTQIGTALSFFIPPQLIGLGEGKSVSRAGDTKTGLLYVYIYLTILPIVLLPLLIFLFKRQPPKPPSFARIAKTDHSIRGWSTVKELAKNTNYILIVMSYSMNVSVYYCMSTLMNQIITDEKFAGTVGAVMVVFGIVGCFFFGWLLDRMPRFKLIALLTYAISIIGLSIFWASRILNWHASAYIVAGVILGTCLSSYVIIAIEFSSELTYPISETITTSILLASGEFASIIFIYMTAILFEHYGIVWVVTTTTAFMVIGMVPTALLNNVQLKRHEALFHPIIVAMKRRSRSVEVEKHQKMKDNQLQSPRSNSPMTNKSETNSSPSKPKETDNTTEMNRDTEAERKSIKMEH